MLELFCLRLIMKSNSLQGNDLLNSSNAIAGFFYDKQNKIVNYFQMGGINKQLVAENTKLKNELDALKYFDTIQNVIGNIPVVAYDTSQVARNADSLSHSATDTPASKPGIVQTVRPHGTPRVVKYASYNYIAARVVNNSVLSDRNNYITINKGTADGIEKDMAVVTSDGVVGRVAYVSKHYAAIISILSSRPVSSQINGGSIGLTNWEGKYPEYVTMSQVDVRTQVQPGDTAYTTGYSYFPENVAIGTVVAVDTYKVNNTLNLKLKLINNFRKLKYVYVVAGKMGSERAELEQQVAEAERQAAAQQRNP